MLNEIDRISKVYRYLENGIDLKLQYGTGNEALSALKNAYDLAHEEPKLHSPWPEITSYRLAHFLMRNANAIDELVKIEQLFEEAERNGSHFLGALPRIYRLAVCMRINEADQSFFDDCVASVRKVMSQIKIFDPSHQTHLVNLLEILAYAGGFDYQSLLGLNPKLKNPFDDLKLGTGLRIIGKGSVLTQITMPRTLALDQAKKLLGENGLVFEWLDNNNFKYHKDKEIVEHSHAWAGLLALLVYKDGLHRESLNRQRESVSLRQDIKRVKKFLSETTGISEEHIYDGDTRRQLALNPKIKMQILGLIKQNVLQKFEQAWLFENRGEQ